MIIVNADDFGRSRAETDIALACYEAGRITSASMMVFMEDSERAAALARNHGLDLGLHLNLSQRFTGPVPSEKLREYHDRIVRFLTTSKYSLLLYHPALRQQFRYVYEAQLDEFVRLYGRRPTHVDGHQHKHLCTNMVLDRIIPADEKVRRNFSFWPGEKNLLNRAYRRLVDRSLSRRYRITDFFFALRQCLEDNRLGRVFELAGRSNVELMTHPANRSEEACLMSDPYLATLRQVKAVSYAAL